MIDDVRTLVTCESPSSDLAALARSADVVGELGARLTGSEPERLLDDGRPHLRWRFGDGDRVLLLGHHDTVWPVGSLEAHPCRVVDGAMYGPGCFDMKAGLVQMFHALAMLPDPDGISVLVTGDEELGAPTSRELIEEEARRARAVLVFEGSADGGALKTARKGIAHYELRIHGRAAHAGLEPWAGVNAAVELAHHVLALAELDAGPDGATVTPTVLSAGTTQNTVPDEASVRVDVRVPDADEARRVDDAIRAVTPRVPGARVDVVTGPSHPPMEPSSSAELYGLAEEVAASLGIDPLGSARVGGASDGNVAAGVGTPTLDGLGAVGGGAHAAGEHVLVDHMPVRAELAAGVIRHLQERPVSTDSGVDEPKNRGERA
ncbi:M20 family peptidase [Actinobacteria bacterium YIM 96077]|uniref:M20 family peptidase n=1 Tax=Phytoactinopolyspora halophila TaxID=1981511 RepID=A0A329R317_9ACTN|nr:M20 family metallopeptidase [Phytoactinopolyspora halophila]AYY15273.1 M20 family peptidase [Actinobacteria bacterium YIM 96077]RAW18930.1 M20 family peptidase [Phytoactinopolyspora halophila]